MLNRRGFLKGFVAVAPAIVAAGNIMTVKRMLWVPRRVDFYVNAQADGPLGDGTLVRPWATLQQAMDYIGKELDLGGHAVNVNIAPGVYEGVDLRPDGDGPRINLVGAGPTRTVLTPIQRRELVIGLRDGDSLDRVTLTT